MLTLYDAPRCPYCARVRIVLAEKAIAYETVPIDLDERPAWIYDLNPTGRVPVLDDDGFVLAESSVRASSKGLGAKEEPPRRSLSVASGGLRTAARYRCPYLCLSVSSTGAWP